MRILLFATMFFLTSSIFFAQEIAITVVEKKGKVDLKVRDGEWQGVQEKDILLTGSEIFTGLHSSITLEFGNGSYITVNQLTKATLTSVRLVKNEINVILTLDSGYMSILSKKNEKFLTKLTVNLGVGNVIFANSGGEVYLRKESGAIIKSIFGKVTVNPKVKTFAFIHKGEICGITAGGLLIEHDYFVRKEIITKPNEILNESQINAYFEIISSPFSLDFGSNDYGNNYRP